MIIQLTNWIGLDSENISLPLEYTDAYKSSKMMKEAGIEISFLFLIDLFLFPSNNKYMIHLIYPFFSYSHIYIINNRSIMMNQPVTMNNHGCGIYPSHFDQTDKLTDFFIPLSNNHDRFVKKMRFYHLFITSCRQNVEFVSTIESINYPIVGVQWHPEKNSFEWGLDEMIL